ncbi:hypothetical protein [uncultured Sulfitobacter sp.]|uniref:hypothetical protein n=1 Tax=uncultured Sulfitobacter sp. TaxID=191468 RepID=UPI0026313104|nr:hypothetical protein [uncultured Sulfitobacter sp.]
MLIDMDHNDFQKAKKAFITAGVLTTIAFRTTVENDQIALFGLKISTTSDQLRAVAVPVFLYFGVIFTLLLINRLAKRNLLISKAREDWEKIDTADGASERERAAAHRNYKIFQAEERNKLLVDLAVPLAISIICMMNIFS